MPVRAKWIRKRYAVRVDLFCFSRDDFRGAEDDGGDSAECLTENIFPQGDNRDELRINAVDATAAFFFDHPRPERIRLHLVRDEVLSVA